MKLANEDYQKNLLKEYREEADFINSFYGLGDKDHFTALELGHIYQLMKEQQWKI